MVVLPASSWLLQARSCDFLKEKILMTLFIGGIYEEVGGQPAEVTNLPQGKQT